METWLSDIADSGSTRIAPGASLINPWFGEMQSDIADSGSSLLCASSPILVRRYR
jgi:hypothetical protein